MSVIDPRRDRLDQTWLDGRIAMLGDGIEAAHDIWINWFEGRHVGRLHPGQTPGQYIASRGGRLTLFEAMAALPDGSTREVAAVAGVSNSTVQVARVRNRTPDASPAEVRGADGKTYPAQRAPVEEDAPVEVSPDPTALDGWYLKVLREYVAGIVNVVPITLGQQPPLMRKRHALERALQAALTKWAEGSK